MKLARFLAVIVCALAAFTPAYAQVANGVSIGTGAISRATSTATRPAITNASGPATVTAASPCVFVFSGGSPQNGQPIILSGGTPMPGNNGAFVNNTVYFVVHSATDGATKYRLAATVGGADLNCPTTTGNTVTANYIYVPNTLIAQSATAGPTVPSFAIPNAACGVIIPRVALQQNAGGNLAAGSYAGSAWDGAIVSINLWSSQPTYAALGDMQPYAPATTTLNWLGNYQVTLTQYGDGAVGASAPTFSNLVMVAPNTTVYWDMDVLSQVYPGSGQQFTLTADLQRSC